MPSIKDQSTVEAIALEFCTNGRNKAKTLEKMGYSKGYSNTQGIGVVYSNIRVKAAIERLDAETREKHAWNYDISIKAIDKRIAYLEPLASAGNIPAIVALTSLLKEKNCITGLQKQTITSKTDEPAASISPELQKDMEAAIRRDKMRRANGGTDSDIEEKRA